MSFRRIGVIGLGAMGSPIARNLVKAGYTVIGFDANAERLERCAQAGVLAASNGAEVVQQCEIVATSLPSSESFVAAAEEVLLPNARPDQIFLDFGTVTPPETRRLACRFAENGATLIDCPVSGGPGGAESGTLYIFIGGDKAVVERCRPIFDVLGDPEHTTYCGSAGNGQVAKGVNQLAMGLGAAAYLEAVAFGVNAGMDAETVAAAVGGKGGTANWREYVEFVAKHVAAGKGENIGVKFRELPYFLREAAEAGFELPLTRTLYDFCDKGERVVIDDNRNAPSFWHELRKR